MGELPDDRRRAERVDVNFEFRDRSSMPTHVSNLSEYGVFVHTEQNLPMGSEVQLRFTIVLDDPVVIAGRGRVVRHQSKPAGMGFEFTHLDPEMLLRVADVVRRNRPRDSGPPIVTAEDDLTSTDGKVRARRVASPVVTSKARPEEDEAAQTLVNLRAVDVEIIDDSELPTDDGADL